MGDFLFIFLTNSICIFTGNIQFDDPLLAYFCAESMIKGMEEKGINHEELLNTYIEAYNKILKGRPSDLNVGVHLCRGNFRVWYCLYIMYLCFIFLQDGIHFSEGGYDRIAVKLFNEIDADCYYVRINVLTIFAYNYFFFNT